MSEKYYPNPDEAPYGVARLGPKYHILDIFDKFPKKEVNYNNYYFYVISGTVLGLGLPILINHGMSRSPLYQLHYTILAGMAGFGITNAGLYYQRRAAIRTEAICRDYVRLHPERFPLIGKF